MSHTQIFEDISHRPQVSDGLHASEGQSFPALLSLSDPLGSFSHLHPDIAGLASLGPFSNSDYGPESMSEGDWPMQLENGTEHPWADRFGDPRGSFGSHPSYFTTPNPQGFVWEDSNQRQTTISGGTFIGGNVNHIQQKELGEYSIGFPNATMQTRTVLGLHILRSAAASDAFHDSAE